jgi:hypothetical protein
MRLMEGVSLRHILSTFINLTMYNNNVIIKKEAIGHQ